MTQHRCTEELRQLREDASHETTSRTKHWGSPSKNQALGELTPESKLDSADPRSPQKFASRRRWSLAPALGLRTVTTFSTWAHFGRNADRGSRGAVQNLLLDLLLLLAPGPRPF